MLHAYDRDVFLIVITCDLSLCVGQCRVRVDKALALQDHQPSIYLVVVPISLLPHAPALAANARKQQ